MLKKELNKICSCRIILNEYKQHIFDDITYYDENAVKFLIILNLIKDIQEFDLQCKQISSQLYKKHSKNLSFILIKTNILMFEDYVFVSQ